MTSIEIANKIVRDLPALSEHAAREAKIWSNYGKVRIYFGRKYIEVYPDGTVDVGSNPYSVSTVVARHATVR